MENTAIRLKKIMTEENLRQVDILSLARPYCEKYNIKLSKSDLSQFVSGKNAPGQWKLTILGLALNVSEAWLMGYDVPKDRGVYDTLYSVARDAVYNREFDSLSAQEKELALNSVRNLPSSISRITQKLPSLTDSQLESIERRVDIYIEDNEEARIKPLRAAALSGAPLTLDEHGDETDTPIPDSDELP